MPPETGKKSLSPAFRPRSGRHPQKGAQIGVHPSSEYMFLILVTPVGPYFKGGFQCTNVCIMREFDRVAPKGTGRWKVGGNYAASMEAGERAKELGYSAVLYLDPKEKKYVDECGPANFFAVKDGAYITPASESILPSVTNKSLMTLAEDMGLKVERRHIPVEELAEIQEAGREILYPSYHSACKF